MKLLVSMVLILASNMVRADEIFVARLKEWRTTDQITAYGFFGMNGYFGFGLLARSVQTFFGTMNIQAFESAEPRSRSIRHISASHFLGLSNLSPGIRRDLSRPDTTTPYNRAGQPDPTPQENAHQLRISSSRFQQARQPIAYVTIYGLYGWTGGQTPYTTTYLFDNISLNDLIPGRISERVYTITSAGPQNVVAGSRVNSLHQWIGTEIVVEYEKVIE